MGETDDWNSQGGWEASQIGYCAVAVWRGSRALSVLARVLGHRRAFGDPDFGLCLVAVPEGSAEPEGFTRRNGAGASHSQPTKSLALA